MKNTKKIISKILIYFALILGVLFCLVPLYWMIRSSLMNTVEVFMMPPRWIPSKFMWENYQEVFDTQLHWDFSCLLVLTEVNGI